jgi:hypothetical protein
MKSRGQDPNCAHLSLLSTPPFRSQLPSIARRRAKLRAEKVQRIKQQIEEGTYDVRPIDIVRGIARSELSWILRLYDAPQR